MSSLILVVLLGIVCILAGVVAGYLTRRRVLRDVPSLAMVLGGILVAGFGFVALVSYLGFLFFPSGMYAAGFGIGRAVRRSLLAAGK